MATDRLTQAFLLEYYFYNKNTGQMLCRKPYGNNKKVKEGDIIGSKHAKGYIHTQIKGKKYLMHRLAWLYTYGDLPKYLDHINQDKTDNRIVNLREVTHQENMKNKPMQTSNTSGVTGVQWYRDSNRWIAFINIDKKRTYLGCFSEFSDAVNARKLAEVAYGYHENHGKG